MLAEALTQAPIALAASFGVLLVVFRHLEVTRPAARRMPMLRALFATDATCWVFTVLAMWHATRIVMIKCRVPVALARRRPCRWVCGGR